MTSSPYHPHIHRPSDKPLSLVSGLLHLLLRVLDLIVEVVGQVHLPQLQPRDLQVQPQLGLREVRLEHLRRR